MSTTGSTLVCKERTDSTLVSTTGSTLVVRREAQEYCIVGTRNAFTCTFCIKERRRAQKLCNRRLTEKTVLGKHALILNIANFVVLY